eukprot:421125_1
MTDKHTNIMYEFELISTGEPTIHITEGPGAFYMEDDKIKLDILDKLNNKWEDIGDLDPELQSSIKSMRPKFQKILTMVIGIDIIITGVLVILSETILKSKDDIVMYAFYGLIVIGVIQTLIILWYIHGAMKNYTISMNKWRKLFNNQMTYYIENILNPTYSNINSSYRIAIHKKGKKLYVVLSYANEYENDDKSSILNYQHVKTQTPPKSYNRQPLLYDEPDHTQGNSHYSSI